MGLWSPVREWRWWRRTWKFFLTKALDTGIAEAFKKHERQAGPLEMKPSSRTWKEYQA